MIGESVPAITRPPPRSTRRTVSPSDLTIAGVVPNAPVFGARAAALSPSTYAGPYAISRRGSSRSAGFFATATPNPPCSATVGVRLIPLAVSNSIRSPYERDRRLIFGE